jgi:hypothetical protein
VVEAVMVAIYGQLMVPTSHVEYIMPYSTVRELYEMVDSKEPVMPDPEDDAHVKRIIQQLIEFMEEPFNKKKIERALTAPWKKSPSLLVRENVTFTIVNGMDTEQYGELLDPIETELVLIAGREKVPILTDQIDFMDKIIDSSVPVRVYDVEDFEFAMEDPGDDDSMEP